MPDVFLHVGESLRQPLPIPELSGLNATSSKKPSLGVDVWVS